MTDPAGTTTAAPPVAGVAGTGPAAPATAPAAPAVATSPARAGDAFLPADESAEPAAAGGEGAPAGTLPPDVHPAVAAERARAGKYRGIASEAFVFDEHGEVVGIRQDFAEKVRDRLGASAPAAALPNGGDASAALDAQVQAFADEHGLLPGQVRGILKLVDYIATQRANEMVAPVMETSLDQMRGTLITSGDVPKEAVPFVNKWHAEAVKANPRAAMTAQGRETILRQALGEYALDLIRRRRSAAPASPAATTPTLLRPTPGGATTGPTAEERALRKSMGLSEDYTALTPREGV